MYVWKVAVVTVFFEETMSLDQGDREESRQGRVREAYMRITRINFFRGIETYPADLRY